MIRPIIYKSVTRCSIALVVVLLWERFVPGRLSSFCDAGFLVALFLFMMSWFSYLKLDGMKVQLPKKEKRSKKKIHWQPSMVDFVDEKIVTFDMLTDEEQTACLMACNFFSGLIFLVVSIVAFL